MKLVNNKGKKLSNLDFLCVKYTYKKEGKEYTIKGHYSTKHLDEMGITHMTVSMWDYITNTLENQDGIWLTWTRAENEYELILSGSERLD